LKRRSGLDGVQGRIQPPLAEFLLNQGERQRRAVNWQLAQAGQQIRQRAHMVFVPVRQQNPLHLVADAKQILWVRDDQVYAGQVFSRKRDTAIHNQCFAVAAD
jgi:hypothetical protein